MNSFHAFTKEMKSSINGQKRLEKRPAQERRFELRRNTQPKHSTLKNSENKIKTTKQ
jgi:hypothetical protein